jgi:hypothetical protein
MFLEPTARSGEGRPGVCLCSPGALFNGVARARTHVLSVFRFYAAELVLAIEHLHSLGIIYR